jgi:hypothetical protein
LQVAVYYIDTTHLGFTGISPPCPP